MVSDRPQLGLPELGLSIQVGQARLEMIQTMNVIDSQFRAGFMRKTAHTFSHPALAHAKVYLEAGFYYVKRQQENGGTPWRKPGIH
jgi:hypothetical protein